MQSFYSVIKVWKRKLVQSIIEKLIQLAKAALSPVWALSPDEVVTAYGAQREFTLDLQKEPWLWYLFCFPLTSQAPESLRAFVLHPGICFLPPFFFLCLGLSLILFHLISP